MQQRNIHIKLKKTASGFFGTFKDIYVFSFLLSAFFLFNSSLLFAQENNGEGRLLEGDILEISGSMKGGFRRKEKQKGMSFTYGDSPYLRESEISNFEEKLLIWQEDLLKIEKKYNDNQEQLLSLQ